MRPRLSRCSLRAEGTVICSLRAGRALADADVGGLVRRSDVVAHRDLLEALRGLQRCGTRAGLPDLSALSFSEASHCVPVPAGVGAADVAGVAPTVASDAASRRTPWSSRSHQTSGAGVVPPEIWKPIAPPPPASSARPVGGELGRAQLGPGQLRLDRRLVRRSGVTSRVAREQARAGVVGVQRRVVDARSVVQERDLQARDRERADARLRDRNPCSSPSSTST